MSASTEHSELVQALSQAFVAEEQQIRRQAQQAPAPRTLRKWRKDDEEESVWTLPSCRWYAIDSGDSRQITRHHHYFTAIGHASQNFGAIPLKVSYDANPKEKSAKPMKKAPPLGKEFAPGAFKAHLLSKALPAGMLDRMVQAAMTEQRNRGKTGIGINAPAALQPQGKGMDTRMMSTVLSPTKRKQLRLPTQQSFYGATLSAQRESSAVARPPPQVKEGSRNPSNLVLEGVPEILEDASDDDDESATSPRQAQSKAAPPVKSTPSSAAKKVTEKIPQCFFQQHGRCVATNRRNINDIIAAVKYITEETSARLEERNCIVEIDVSGTRVARTSSGISSLLRELVPALSVVFNSSESRVKLHDVRSLVCDDCALDDADAEFLARLLKSKTFPLGQLSLRRNHITAIGAEHLKKAIKYNPTVTEVDLGDNPGITAPGQAFDGEEILRTIAQRVANNRVGEPNMSLWKRIVS